MELNELQKNRIRKGAMLLDEKVPDWHTRVNLDRLDIDSFSLCVVCQIFGNFYDGLDALGLSNVARPSDYDEVTIKNAAEHGFYPHADEAIDIMQMTEEDFNMTEDRARHKNAFWSAQIYLRRGADSSEQ